MLKVVKMNKKRIIKKFAKVLDERYRDSTGAVHRRSDSDFEVLISCILSQRTTDANTEKASSQLFAVARTPKEVLKLSDKELEKLIRPSGFYREKTKTIKKVCGMLLEKYSGKVPYTREELMSLPGVGYKTSAVVMSYCFGAPIIPVDVHVEVISKRLGFAPKNADVEAVRESLEKLVPPKKRYKFHLKMIHFGKDTCRTANPRCQICPMNDVCQYGKKRLRYLKKRTEKV